MAEIFSSPPQTCFASAAEAMEVFASDAAVVSQRLLLCGGRRGPQELLPHLLTRNHKHRYTITQIQQHDFFSMSYTTAVTQQQTKAAFEAVSTDVAAGARAVQRKLDSVERQLVQQLGQTVTVLSNQLSETQRQTLNSHCTTARTAVTTAQTALSETVVELEQLVIGGQSVTRKHLWHVKQVTNTATIALESLAQFISTTSDISAAAEAGDAVDDVVNRVRQRLQKVEEMRSVGSVGGGQALVNGVLQLQRQLSSAAEKLLQLSATPAATATTTATTAATTTATMTATTTATAADDDEDVSPSSGFSRLLK